MRRSFARRISGWSELGDDRVSAKGEHVRLCDLLKLGASRERRPGGKAPGGGRRGHVDGQPESRKAARSARAEWSATTRGSSCCRRRRGSQSILIAAVATKRRHFTIPTRTYRQIALAVFATTLLPLDSMLARTCWFLSRELRALYRVAARWGQGVPHARRSRSRTTTRIPDIPIGDRSGVWQRAGTLERSHRERTQSPDFMCGKRLIGGNTAIAICPRRDRSYGCIAFVGECTSFMPSRCSGIQR